MIKKIQFCLKKMIIPTAFTKLGEYGDFEFMIKSKLYDDCLFIYNDNTENRHGSYKGKGNAIIRPWNKYNKNLEIPKSAGICTGSLFDKSDYLKYKGFKVLNDEIKEINN